VSQLIKIGHWAEEPRASVMFVHGLGGHPYDTWRRRPDESFWPLWLAEDIRGLAVYTLRYEAPATNWLGTAMPLQDRAVNVLETLLGGPALRDHPIIFVVHSLGGLLVKQVLLDLHQQKGRRPEAAALLECVTQVVFIATPHTGSRKASLLDRLRFLAWPSSMARVLVANDPSLRAINVAYRGLAEELGGKLRHRIFYETHERKPASSWTRPAAILACLAIRPFRSMPTIGRSPNRSTARRCSMLASGTSYRASSLRQRDQVRSSLTRSHRCGASSPGTSLPSWFGWRRLALWG
jgi:pimeloyl-ACP methyl ester carboxylesterase